MEIGFSLALTQAHGVMWQAVDPPHTSPGRTPKGAMGVAKNLAAKGKQGVLWLPEGVIHWSFSK